MCCVELDSGQKCATFVVPGLCFNLRKFYLQHIRSIMQHLWFKALNWLELVFETNESKVGHCVAYYDLFKVLAPKFITES